MKSDYDGRVVSVRKSDTYKPLCDQFGWIPLKNITVESAQSKLGLSKSEIEETRGKTAESVEDEMLKVYEGRNSMKYAVKEIKENSSLSSGVLVLFPRGYDKNLTDNKWLSGNGVAITSCTKKVKKYLIDNEYVMTYQDYINWSLKTVVDTENGTMSVAGFINDDDKSVLYLKDDVDPVLQESSTVSTIKKGLEKTESCIDKSTMLGVVSNERFKHVENSHKLSNDFTPDRQDFLVLPESYRYSLSNRNLYEVEKIDTSEVDAYLRSSMTGEVYESQVSKNVENMFDGFNKDMICLVSSINESYDIGGLNMLDVTAGFVLRNTASLEYGQLIGQKSGGLGYGLPASVGVAIAEEETKSPRNVICYVGDGSYQYYTQTLYTAERYVDESLSIIVPENGGYEILRSADVVEDKSPTTDKSLSFDSQGRIAMNAESYGVRGNVYNYDEQKLEEVIADEVESCEVTLLEVPIAF